AAEQQMLTVANAALQNAASELYSDRTAFAEDYRDQFGEAATDEEIEQFRQDTLAHIRDGRVRLAGHEAAVSTALTHAIQNVPWLIEFDWTLLRAPSGGFITSDR